jgi:hypothetical protein
MRIDHAVIAVRDLDDAADRLHREHGLASVGGGRHPAWGTANRIVPLGEDYLELIAVVDPEIAGSSPFGRTVLAAADDGDHPLTICAAPADLDAVARRLGLDIATGERRRPDGTTIRWRSAALEDPRREPWMPFFIAWELQPAEHPGRTPVRHDVRDVRGIARIQVAGDEARLTDWLGGETLPIEVVAHDPSGVRSIVVAADDGEIVLL